jgi:4-amino-4-deoxy-L-arabinose transferase-like glycosyltransferase
MILVLWAIPVSIFFSGYPVIWASPVRFIMPAYAAIIASFVCMDLWGEASGKKKYLLLFAISITVLLVSPCFRLECPYPFGMENYKFGMAANLILNICMPVLLFSLSFVYMKTNYRIFLFLMLFLVLFYSGSPYLLFIMLLFHLAVSVTHWVVDVKHTLFIPAEAG